MGEEFAFDHDLRTGRDLEIDGFTFHQVDGFAEKGSRNLEFIQSQGEKTGPCGEEEGGVVTDDDGHLEVPVHPLRFAIDHPLVSLEYAVSQRDLMTVRLNEALDTTFRSFTTTHALAMYFPPSVGSTDGGKSAHIYPVARELL
jgi:hypothetical protein